MTVLAAREIYRSNRVALIAGTFAAITPIFVWDAHFATSDMGLLLWTALAFYLATVAANRPSLKIYVLGGLVVGLAIATKFNGALVGTSFIAASVIGAARGRVSWQVATRLLIIAGVLSLVGFGLASPYSIEHLGETVEAFAFETRHVSGGHFGFDLDAVGWQYTKGIYQLAAAFPFSFGFALYAAVLAGLVAAIRVSSWRQTLLLLAFPAAYMAATTSWIFVPLRYYMPIFPMLLIAAAVGLDRLIGGEGTRKRVGMTALGLVVAYTLVFTVTSTWRFTEDTRVTAARWLEDELPAQSHLVYLQPRFQISYMPDPDRPDVQTRRMGVQGIRAARSFASTAAGDGLLVTSGLTYHRYYRQGRPEWQGIWDAVRKRSGELRTRSYVRHVVPQ